MNIPSPYVSPYPPTPPLATTPLSIFVGAQRLFENHWCKKKKSIGFLAFIEYLLCTKHFLWFISLNPSVSWERNFTKEETEILSLNKVLLKHLLFSRHFSRLGDTALNKTKNLLSKAYNLRAQKSELVQNEDNVLRSACVPCCIYPLPERLLVITSFPEQSGLLQTPTSMTDCCSL